MSIPVSATPESVETTPHPAPLDFSAALAALKSGQLAARLGWNGRGMYVFLQAGYPEGIPINRNTAQATGLQEGAVVKFPPYLQFRTAQGELIPWVASQADLLATDWVAMSKPAPALRPEAGPAGEPCRLCGAVEGCHVADGFHPPRPCPMHRE